jgi:hypothetical protein
MTGGWFDAETERVLSEDLSRHYWITEAPKAKDASFGASVLRHTLERRGVTRIRDPVLELEAVPHVVQSPLSATRAEQCERWAAHERSTSRLARNLSFRGPLECSLRVSAVAVVRFVASPWARTTVMKCLMPTCPSI